MTEHIQSPGGFLGGYKLLNILGKGLSGEVWAALGKDKTVVALKIFASGTSLEAVESEFRTGAQMNHRNILSPLSFFSSEGVNVIVMPLCNGRSVDNAAGYYSEQATWKLILDISSAIAYLHSGNFCHADIKPSNILRRDKDFFLADFGSCFEMGTNTSAGDVSSYIYSAPEKNRTSESDIWSLGASVFFLVTGTQVFGGLGGKAQKRDSVIPFLRRSMPELSEFVIRCLAFEPSDRPTAVEAISLAESNLCRLSETKAIRPKRNGVLPGRNEYEDFWPETMSEAK